MKVAIIFSGHTRTFAQCYPTFVWQVQRHFPNASVIFSTIDDKDYRECFTNNRFPNGWRIGLEEGQPTFTFNKEWKQFHPFTHEPYPISVSPEAVMRQLWQLERAYKLYIENTEEKDFADVFIRARPDLWWMGYDHSVIKRETADWPHKLLSTECFTPWWGRFGGVNDRFAIMGRDAADAYFQTFSRVHMLRSHGCPLHPESLISASMEEAGITVHRSLRAYFATMKTDGTIRLPEISSIDIADLI